MTPEDIKAIGLYQDPKRPHIFTDMEDIVFNLRSKELYSLDCTDGNLELIRKVIDLADLKQALYDCFPYNRNELNLDKNYG